MSQQQTPRPGGSYPLAGRDVSRIGYGAMQLERLAHSEAGRASASALLQRAVAEGVNHIDTASFYGDCTVNKLIAEALSPYPDDLVIVSKVGAAHVAGGSPPLAAAQRPEQLRAAVEADLRSLAVEQVTVVNLRRLDPPSGVLATGDQVVALEDQLAELIALRDEGKIGAIGVSNISAENLLRALPAGIVCVQNAYSVIDRHAEPLLEICLAHELAWVPFFPLGSAFPQLPKVVDQPVVIAAARRLGCTPADVGLAWLLAHAPNTLLIPGTTSIEHLLANIAVGALELDPETIAELDALSPPPAGNQQPQ